MSKSVVGIIGIILIIAGILGFIFGGISFTESETVMDVGPLEVQQERERSIPIGPMASGAAVVVGLVLVVASRRSD